MDPGTVDEVDKQEWELGECGGRRLRSKKMIPRWCRYVGNEVKRTLQKPKILEKPRPKNVGKQIYNQ
jgi:hypothetical protein